MAPARPPSSSPLSWSGEGGRSAPGTPSSSSPAVPTSLQLFAQTVEPAHRIGFEYRRDESYTARLDGADVRSLAELPGAFFVEVIDPEVHRLVEGAPGGAPALAGLGSVPRGTWLPGALAAVQPGAAAAERGAEAGWRIPVPGMSNWSLHGEQVAAAPGRMVRSRAALSGRGRPATVGTGAGVELFPGLVGGTQSGRGAGGRAGARPGAGQHPGRTAAGRCASAGGRQGRRGRVFPAASRSWWRRPWCWPCCSGLRELQSSRRRRCCWTILPPSWTRSGWPRWCELVAELDCQLIITSLDPDLGIFGKPERVFHVEQGAVQRL